MLLVAQGRRLAGRPAGNERIGALLDLPGDQILKCPLVDGAAPKRRDESDAGALEHRLSSGGDRIAATIQPPRPTGNKGGRLSKGESRRQTNLTKRVNIEPFHRVMRS